MIIYNLLKKYNFYICMVFIAIMGITIFYIPIYKMSKYHNILLRIMFISPIVFNWYLTLIVYKFNKNSIFMKFLYFSLGIYNFIFILFIVYEYIVLNTLNEIKLLDILIKIQFLFELYLLLITIIFILLKKIKRISLKKLIIFFTVGLYCFPIKESKVISDILAFLISNIISGILVIILIILTAFNPVLIYILCLVAKEELLLDDEKN